MTQLIEKQRRKPTQQRAQQTVDAILDAAAQILRSQGETHFTTNRIAERAGVSVGTLYQYFKDKDVILMRLSDREVARLRDEIREVILSGAAVSLEGNTRRLVRTLIDFFVRRRRSKRIILLKLLTLLGNKKPEAEIRETLLELTHLWNGSGLNPWHVDENSMFVLAQSILGVLRSAMIMRPALLDSSDLEDRLVHLLLSYLMTPPDTQWSRSHDDHRQPIPADR